MLSCACQEYDPEVHSYYFEADVDFSTFNGIRRARCCSCKEVINYRDAVLVFSRIRSPKDEVETRIHGEDGEIKMADWRMCEGCGEIYLNLTAAGFCIHPDSPMSEALEEYHALSGFKTEEVTK